ncbi:MAG TPA: GNAT family N-acetyltransferase [Phycisphaerales bacterium]|nr:GNAT family N-acetyltransferase [Phycisphaerales bacterium]
MTSARTPKGPRGSSTSTPALSFMLATDDDAEEIASLRNRAAEHLTQLHGRGHWSGMVTDKGVLHGISNTSRVLIARDRKGTIIATLRLATKKPWAIDVAYFTNVPRVLYLLDMAVEPAMQQRGIGRRLMAEAVKAARDWPGEAISAIRLDAYAHPQAGAGDFYARCGYREVGRVVYRGVSLVYFELLLPAGT